MSRVSAACPPGPSHSFETSARPARPSRSRWRSALLGRCLGLCLSLVGGLSLAQSPADLAVGLPDGGPMRLRQPTLTLPVGPAPASTGSVAASNAAPEAPVHYRPGEFEAYVQSLAGNAEVRRFGAELITGPAAALAVSEANPVIPPDYIVQVGDELLVNLWGSVDADLRLSVDRNGRVAIPRVGPVLVAGLRYADLTDALTRRVGTVFRNFQLSVSLGQLRGVRVYVTGFVARPGAQLVSGLSTLVQAVIRAGGPTAAGSFRRVELRRQGQTIASFDLYDLLIKGERGADRVLQSDDVVVIGPVGPQIAVLGSVNRAAIFELKPGENLSHLLQMAGGFSAIADTSRVVIERLEDRRGARTVQLDLPQALRSELAAGDVVRALSATAVVLPVHQQNKRVRIEGEVLRPGDYVLSPDSSLDDALQAAGGLTPAAFLYGTEFLRESVRITQQQQYERALRDLESDFSRSAAMQRVTNAEEAAAQSAITQSSARLIEQLRAVKPTGRIVLNMSPEAPQLPALALEDGDRLYIPPRPTTIGVFGSVYNAGSYLYAPQRGVLTYLDSAGGPTRGADQTSLFVVRANGTVVSASSSRGVFNQHGDLAKLQAEPGDTIFVPEEAFKTTFVQGAKDWTQILYYFGVGLAGLKNAFN